MNIGHLISRLALIRLPRGPAFSSIVANVFRTLISFVATIVTITILGIEQFGVLSAIIAHLVVTHYLGTLGLDHSFPKPGYLELARALIIVGATVSFTTGLILSFSIYFFSEIGRNFSVAFVLLAAQAILTGIGAILSGFFRLTQRYFLLILKDQIFLPSIALLAGLSLLIFGRSVVIYSAVYFSMTFLVVASFLYIARHDLRNAEALPSQVKPALAKIWQSMPVAIMSAIENFGPAVLIVIAAYVVTYEQVGILATAIRFGALTGFFYLALTPVLSGRLGSELSLMSDQSQNMIRGYSLLSVGGALLTYVFFISFGVEITRLLGIEDNEARLVWVAAFAAFFIDSLSSIFKVVLVRSGEEIQLGLIQFIGFLCIVMTAIPLGNMFGSVGLIAGLCVGFLVVSLGRLYRLQAICPGCGTWLARQRILITGGVMGILQTIVVIFGANLWVRFTIFSITTVFFINCLRFYFSGYDSQKY